MFRLHKELRVNTRIPSDHNGLESSLEVIKEGNVNSLSVDVDIKNTDSNDIQLELVSPNGKRVTLKSKGTANKSGTPTKWQQSFSGSALEPFQGIASKGRWKLIAKNHSINSVPVLNSWSLKMDCKPVANCPNEIFTNNAKAETLVSNQLCRFNGTVAALKVLVDIDHPSKKDLVVKLSSPSGKSITLHDKVGDGRWQSTTYDVNATKGLSGERTNGNWKLSVQDFDGNTKVGKLRKWKLFMDYDPVDSLVGIDGIDVNAHRALQNAGINSYSKLASSAPNTIKEVFEKANVEMKNINIEQIRQHAKKALEDYTV